MRISLEINEVELRKIVIDWLSNKIGFELSATDVDIEAKSKQNYKSEWEQAAFRARVEKTI